MLHFRRVEQGGQHKGGGDGLLPGAVAGALFQRKPSMHGHLRAGDGHEAALWAAPLPVGCQRAGDPDPEQVRDRVGFKLPGARQGGERQIGGGLG